MRASAWDVIKHLGETNNRSLRLAPMSNVLNVRKVKAGTQVTIGVGEDIIAGIANGSLVGGFLYCDRAVWRAAEAQLSAEAEGPA